MSHKQSEKLTNSHTDRVMARLAAQYPEEIAWGKHYAIKLACRNGSVHSRMMRERMAAEGLIGRKEQGREHWIGAVFNQLQKEGIIIWNNLWHKYWSDERNVHERTVKCWAILKESNYPQYFVRPDL